MASLFCPVCGTENPSTRQFCRKCAADLRAPAPDPNAAVVADAPAVGGRPIVLGAAAALVLLAFVVAAVVMFGGAPAASNVPLPTVTDAPTTTPTEPSVATATAAAIETPEVTPEETTVGTPAPIASGTPVVDSLKGPGSASCTTTNGTALAGYVKLTWVASNTSGVRLSIDPPAPNNAYAYGYDDYPASGSAEVPFTCDPPNSDARGAYHLYVATTVHDGGYFAYRYIKVYIKA